MGAPQERRLFPAEIAVSKAPLSRREMFVLCLRDVTERRESEQAMRESAARYRLLVDHAPEAIVVLDVDTGRFMDANDKAEKLFGLQRRGCSRRADRDEPAAAARRRSLAQRARAFIQRALEGEVPVFEWAHCDASGHEIMCEVRLVRLPSGNRRLVRGSIADISERKRGRAHGGRRAQGVRAGDPPTRRCRGAASITRLIESALPGTLSSVSVLADRTARRSSYMVAPRLSATGCAWRSSARSVSIRNGSCAAAVYLDARCCWPTLARIRSGERREAALARGLRAAWSTPIKAAGGKRARVARRLPRRTRACRAAPSRRSWRMPRSWPASPLSGASRRGPAQQRGEIPRPVREHRRGVYQSGRDGRLLSVNPAFVTMLGYGSAEELYALPWPRRSTGTRPTARSSRAAWSREGEIRDAEFLHAHAATASSS